MKNPNKLGGIQNNRINYDRVFKNLIKGWKNICYRRYTWISKRESKGCQRIYKKRHIRT